MLPMHAGKRYAAALWPSIAAAAAASDGSVKMGGCTDVAFCGVFVWCGKKER